MNQKITPFLWFDKECEEAVNFYVSLFENSMIISLQKYPDNVDVEHIKGMEGKILTAVFELAGQKFMALDGGPIFKFTPSISFLVYLKTEEEIDSLWVKLINSGSSLMPLDKYPFAKKYGWLMDKYGLTWQLMLSDTDATQKINPLLMFTGENAGKSKEAINFYTSLFKDSELISSMNYEEGEPDKPEYIKHAEFKLSNQIFMAMDSGYSHKFGFNEAVSFYVECDGQEEVDYFWDKMTSDGGEESQCGWLKDKYGVSWQIIPKQLGELISKDQTGKVMIAMLQMKKIIIKNLEAAINN